MAHECIDCGCDCFCGGDISDSVDNDGEFCRGCGCEYGYNEDDDFEDDFNRTCDTCGGEFWDGGTSCSCDYEEPIGKLNPICFVIGHAKHGKKDRCNRCQMSPWHDSCQFSSTPFRKSYHFTLPWIISGWWYSFKWKCITRPLQKYRIYDYCGGCNKPTMLFGKATKHDHSNCLPF